MSGSVFWRMLGIHLLIALPAMIVLGLSAGRVGAATATAGILSVAAIAVGLSAIVAKSTARTLDRIAAQVRRVTEGSYAPVSPQGPAEARSLTRVIDEMAADLGVRMEELRNESALREQILSTMEEGVILARDDGIVYANPSARRLFGAALRTLPPQLPRADDGSVVTKTFTLHHPAERELRSSAARVGGDMTLVVVQDVTESERIDRVRRDFVANASHEMKTPVAGILATAETLRTAIHDDPEAAKRFAETLAIEATRLSRLIQDLLDLARLDRPDETTADVDLSKLILEEIEHASPLAEAKSLALSVTVDEGLVVQGRAEDLAALPRNLIDNALRHTTAGGAVSVRLHVEGTDAVLTVADSGAGIPAKDLPRIFERFYRVDQARARETGGTGLGLAIVRHVAESHGGRVGVTSELGRGSTFVVRLPLPRD